MKPLQNIALALSILTIPAFSQDVSISGVWKVTGDIQGVRVDRDCTFTQEGKKLTGICKANTKKESSQATGEIDGKKITWTYKSDYNGNELTITFTGKLDDTSQIKGTIDVDPASLTGTFTAVKADAKKTD